MKNTRSAVEAIAQRMIAAEDTREMRVGDGILEYIDRLPGPIRKDIQRLIFLFEYLPPLVILAGSLGSRRTTRTAISKRGARVGSGCCARDFACSRIFRSAPTTKIPP